MSVGGSRYCMKKNLALWRIRDSFKLSEAALLITESYPDDWSDEKLLTMPPIGFKPVYGQMLADAVKIIDEHAQSQEYQDVVYVEYALMTDKPEKQKKLAAKDGLSVMVEQHELSRWLKANRITARFFEDDSLTTFEVPNKELGTRERDALHRVIGGLLVTLLEEAMSSPESRFKTQEALIQYFAEQYHGYEGFSKSNLDKLFPVAKRLISAIS